MNILVAQLQQILPKGMTIPQPLVQLYEWIEDNNLYIDTDNGVRVGFLYPQDELRKSKIERNGGTMIEFYAQPQESLKFWFGRDSDEIYSRLFVFGKTGEDWSECALWLDDEGNTQIIHLGSGSGSLLCCILTNDAIDFIRLLAIGYDEICRNEVFQFPPNESDGDEYFVHPNIKFRNWVKSKFHVDIPRTALDIIKHPDEMGDLDTHDAFCNWCNIQARRVVVA